MANTRNPNSVSFPGSFDPFTHGHVNIVERATQIFSEVHIAVLDNNTKKGLFTPEERVNLIKDIFKENSAVKVSAFSGLLVDFLKINQIKIIIRGLRAISDYDYEAQMALLNRKLDPEIETLFMTSKEEYSYISSTMVRQIAPLGGDVSKLVHPVIVKALNSKFKNIKQ